jgi:glycosyltransferase involved in cell wall biosynthesis
MSMKLSVALCTYNGERFLGEQLRSLATQLRPPDELVVCDDASADSTPVILEQFSRECPFSIRVERNTANIGIAANFSKAISLCTGDVILTCDQDDIWHSNKLAAIQHELDRRPDAGLVFSDAVRIDEQGAVLRDSLWCTLAVSPLELQQLESGDGVKTLCRRNIVTGATLAFPSQWRDLVLPVPAGWIHDAWIVLLISAVSPVVAIREPLIQYRQHASQQIGGERLGLFEQYRRAREMRAASFQDAAERFAEAKDRLSRWPAIPAHYLKVIEEKIGHAEARGQMRRTGGWRLPKILSEWRRGNYSRFSRGWKAAAQDLFLP